MKKNLNTWLLVTGALLLSIEIIALVIYASTFIPYPSYWSDPFLKGVEPERETFFYLVFLAISFVLTGLGVKYVLPQMSSLGFCRKFKCGLVLEGIWCFLMVFCFFKWTTYRYPFWNILPFENSTWLQPFFCLVCGASLLSKIFFVEINACWQQVPSYAGMKSYPQHVVTTFQIIFWAFIFLLLYVPHPQDISALAFAFDQWNHLDPFTGWFIKQGWPINYEQSIMVLIGLCLAYLVGVFYLIRLWLHSWLLAAVGVLLTIKMGMFYDACAPCVWINPSNTFLAHGWDIFLLGGLWFVTHKYPKAFYSAAVLTGLVIVYGWFHAQGYMAMLGLDNQPLMAPLHVRQFFPFFMGYFVPLFYAVSLLVMMGQRNVGGSLARIICIYGLMIFTDYLERPTVGYYGSLMVPAILIFCWWLNQMFASATILLRRCVYGVILILALGALLTNRLMLTYPNIFFQDPKQFAQAKAFQERFHIIDQSADLIKQLTQENQKVALLSNFETAILMQAHREPLFDHFPIMYSSYTSNPGGLNLKTQKQCLRVIDDLKEENASYIFVDERIWSLLPEALVSSGLSEILDYVRKHYQKYRAQGLLVALQRR